MNNDDVNPFNGNEHLLRQFNTSANGPNQISFGSVSIDVNASNALPGVHSLYAKITGAGRTRYLYAPELLTVFSSFQPPHLAIPLGVGPPLSLDILGIAGQRVVLQSTGDFQTWQSIATNWLTTSCWNYSLNGIGQGKQFYRAILQ